MLAFQQAFLPEERELIRPSISEEDFKTINKKDELGKANVQTRIKAFGIYC